jgi:folate-binding protein YgfZ
MSFFAVLPSAALRVTGADRVPFVHGQVSNDVRGLPEPGVCRTMILNARGQIEFDVRVYKRADDLYIHAAEGLGAALLERLQRYVVFDDVKLEDISARLAVFHVSSDLASGLGWSGGVQLLPTDGFGTVLVAPVQRGLEGGVDVHVLADHADALEAQLAARGERLSDADLECSRLRAGLADAHRDGFLGRLPQECGLEDAVSYKKGCYIGQEIMARLEARGNTRYALQAVTLEVSAPVGTPVTLEGREVGQLGSSVQDGEALIGLAVLRVDLALDAVLEAGGVRLRAR